MLRLTDASKVGVVEGSECPEVFVMALTPTAEWDNSVIILLILHRVVKRLAIPTRL